uniref:transposase n=2 Tax=Candidatus Enterovibrio escicola TaxID=1927127 RepID=UPI001237B598|nr:transposase [Candidatus Enterovibrio escacola]
MTKGALSQSKVTMTNVNDRKSISEMVDEFWECLYGDQGYISDLLEREPEDKGVILITGVKKKMKPKVMKL